MASHAKDLIATGLIQDLLEGRIPPQEFCSAYENWWNFDADKGSYTDGIREVLNKLFDVASLYTPIDEDRQYYRGYTSIEELFLSAKLTQDAILLEGDSTGDSPDA